MREKLETLSVSVLKEFAKDKHIKNISTMRKSQLIDAIIAANEAEEADGYKVAPVQEESAKSAGEKDKTVKYSDLISFNPIEDVIQLVTAEEQHVMKDIVSQQVQ